MSTNPNRVPRPSIVTHGDSISARADVLVIGGGPAGCWAAIAAAQDGASVVLVDKGYCGTTGAAASAGVGVWYVEPDRSEREQAMAYREALGGWLADRHWMGRVLDETYEQVGRLADWGYPFPVREDGAQARRSLQGPEYMRRMRKQVVRSRVTIWDHSPALELLTTDDGAVAGATGVRRQRGGRWTVSAGAVIVATGGCAFQSGGLGCDVLTGDGHLLAAEAGAELSGMEFSNSYAISPAFSSVTKTAFYHWASFSLGDGTVLDDAGGALALADRPCAAARARVLRPGSRPAGHLGGAAPRATELLPAVRPGTDRPVHAAVPGHAAPGGHGARDRRPARRR
jgi:succinate dehydrogenase/fumarate reductase flavoprotein subunit